MFDIGASLRTAREKRGLTAEDVHMSLRIRERYLRALEEERWELLPGDAYAKGFLRTYAEFLGTARSTSTSSTPASVSASRDRRADAARANPRRPRRARPRARRPRAPRGGRTHAPRV
jgi:cytoskeletal protein RodZ